MDDRWRRETASVLVMARKRYALRHPGRVTRAIWAAALSELTGRRLAEETISKWEAGRQEPSGGVVLAALVLADVNLEEVLRPTIADDMARLRRLMGLTDDERSGPSADRR